MNSYVTLYSLPTCGKCKILKQKMQDKHIKFKEVQDVETLGAKGIESVPVLEVGDSQLNFIEANEWVNQKGN